MKKYELIGARYLIESIAGAILTLILFAVLKNMKEWPSSVLTILLIVCLLIDAYSFRKSIRMKKFAKKREIVGEGEGLSHQIVIQNDYKTVAKIIKMVIIAIMFSRLFW